MAATDVLREEHDEILTMLGVLAELEHTAQWHDLNRDDAAIVLDFFRNFADRCHHAKEERYLFPALVAAGLPVDGGPIGVMLAEHERGRALIQQMAAALRDAGRDGDRRFAVAAADYRDLLTMHINKENMALFPQAEQVLSGRVQNELRDAYERIEREEMGEGIHERYHAVIEEMAAKSRTGRNERACGC